jgi:tRNA pseudouridine38-40 synthase
MRHVLGIAYRGDHYFGWQSQDDYPTVQGFVESCLSKIANEKIRVYCAGRTDRGVHASSQVIHFDSNAIRTSDNWIRGMNTLLPDDIQVIWHRETDSDFHARHCALSRQYAYLMYQDSIPNILWSKHALMVDATLDLKLLRASADILEGAHDFTSFRAANCQAKDPNKIIRKIEIIQKGPWLCVKFQANAFLYHMIRIMMDTMLSVAFSKNNLKWLKNVLESKDRSMAETMVPANGLYFQGAEYHEKYDIPVFKDIMNGEF